MSIPFSVFAQKRISGTVTDASGEPLIGANVVEKGTTNGNITDWDGKFVLTVGNNAVLQVSYVGFVTQEIPVGSQTTLTVTLHEDTEALDEVVVVGYGTQRRQAVTGAVAKANLEVFKDVPSNNILDKVKGSLPGLNIDGTNRSGQVPGIIIRGQNSTGGNSPLIVVDGAIFAGSLADISTYDIESFTVLKDASAAAVYGSRSANGVILIETKRGKGNKGKPVFNVNLNYGISNEMNRPEIYGPDAYLQRLLDIRELNDLEHDPAKIEFYLTDEERKNYLATPDHKPTVPDPWAICSQSGFNRNVSISIANQTEKSRYYIAASYIDQRGVELNDQYQNFTGRLNIDSDITNWFNLGIKTFYSFRDNSGSLLLGEKTHFSPWATVKDENGNYTYLPNGAIASFTSPFWKAATSDVKLRNNLNGIVNATIKAPWIQGLSFVSTLSNTLQWHNDNSFWDTNTVDGMAVNGKGSRQATNYYNLLWDNMLKYTNIFADKHYLDVTMLFSQEKYTYEMVKASAQDFDDKTLQDYRLEDGKTQFAETGGSESESIGLMARATYTYDNKYSLTGTIRRDGYSAFSKNKKYGTFPSVGINWNLKRESFLRNVTALDNLAIRATYGTNGNQSISLYQTLAKIATDQYYFAGNSGYSITQYISSLATDDLSWETTTGLNLGIDFSIFNNRLSGAIDMYQTRTNDLLFSLNIPQISGMGSITSNVGEIQNKGFELSLRSLNIDNGDFKWSSDFAFSINRNKIVSILGEDNDGDGKEDDLISSGYFIGKSLSAIYTYKVIGMYQQADVDNGTIMNGWRPGEYILEDLDGDGKITSDKDRQILGNRKENFRWSLTNTLRYKGFALMAYLYSIWGGNGWYLSNTNYPNNGYAGRADINHPIFDYWTPRNTDAFFQRTDYGRKGAVGGYKLIDRSFIKLQKVSLTYDVGQWVKPWGINDLTIGLSADNLFTYAPYWIGLDPETEQGMTDTAVPSIRTYNFSVTINF
jgi:TonB-linked SusC/RagA family outer membrane protein